MQALLAVFRYHSDWTWESLPQAYLSGPYLTLDCSHVESSGDNDFPASDSATENDPSDGGPGSDAVTIILDTPTEESIPPKVQIDRNIIYIIHFEFVYTQNKAVTVSKALEKVRVTLKAIESLALNFT